MQKMRGLNYKIIYISVYQHTYHFIRLEIILKNYIEILKK